MKLRNITDKEIEEIINATIKKVYWCRKFYIKDTPRYQISFSKRERCNKMKTKEWDNVTNDFILHKMLKGTEIIIYADKLWIIDKHNAPLYYYKVSTIDTKGIIRNYIRVAHNDEYVQVFPYTTI